MPTERGERDDGEIGDLDGLEIAQAASLLGSNSGNGLKYGAGAIWGNGRNLKQVPIMPTISPVRVDWVSRKANCLTNCPWRSPLAGSMSGSKCPSRREGWGK